MKSLFRERCGKYKYQKGKYHIFPLVVTKEVGEKECKMIELVINIPRKTNFSSYEEFVCFLQEEIFLQYDFGLLIKIEKIICFSVLEEGYFEFLSKEIQELKKIKVDSDSEVEEILGFFSKFQVISLLVDIPKRKNLNYRLFSCFIYDELHLQLSFGTKQNKFEEIKALLSFNVSNEEEFWENAEKVDKIHSDSI